MARRNRWSGGVTLLLTLEQGPRAQSMRQARLEEGEIVIGRSADADWQIDDPDMFVSRAHCRVTARDDGYFVTDTSSSGLFVDSSSSPLGAGNVTRLQQGMRLRLGDYVLSVEMATPAPRAASTETNASAASLQDSRTSSAGLLRDDFFSMATPEVPQQQRPEGLPSPFERPEPGAYERSDAKRDSPAFDDPFSLDPVATPFDEKADSPAQREDPFGFDADPTPLASAPPSSRTQGDVAGSFDDDFGFGSPPHPIEPEAIGRREASTSEASAPPLKPARAPWELPPDEEARAPAPIARTPPPPAPKPLREHRPPSLPKAAQLEAAGVHDASGAREAFLRGLGLQEEDMRGRDPIAEMERFGREYRLMMEGLMQLLRKRAEEKGNARIAQTVVGSSGVNPLKFLPTVDDALATILADDSPGFLNGEAAVSDAVRDLAQHHVRAWRGVQGALRRMIDRFDPASIEEELKSGSSIGTLLTGGRGAKLWELYQKRHREIATSAESRFLGEIGADFRDAYEEE